MYSARLTKGHETIEMADPVVGWVHYQVPGEGWMLEVMSTEPGKVVGWTTPTFRGAIVSVHEGGQFSVAGTPAPQPPPPDPLAQARAYLKEHYKGEIGGPNELLRQDLVLVVINELLEEIDVLDPWEV